MSLAAGPGQTAAALSTAVPCRPAAAASPQAPRWAPARQAAPPWGGPRRATPCAGSTAALAAAAAAGAAARGSPPPAARQGPSPPPPRSCDTFVVLPAPATGLPACFGKNSDRPSEEEHEVVHVPRRQHAEGSAVRCTYVDVPQARETLAVVLSKPRWLWGCEMGANERGVVGGNEAVWTRAAGELGGEARLLGMDLLRLALERGATAAGAARACTDLLEAHGQGGGCAEDDDGWTYENGFIFADASEAFVVETAGVSWWAVERVPLGSFRNISNGISIRSEHHALHPGLKQHCRERGWWDGTEPFDFKAVLTGTSSTAQLAPAGRERCGRELLGDLARDAAAGRVASPEALARRMMAVLRDEPSGICFRDLHSFSSTGSQVSVLPRATGEGGSSGEPSAHGAGQHFFTCASDPTRTAYKRFGFSGPEQADVGPLSLELWRQHRRRALAGAAPPAGVAALEARPLGASGEPGPALGRLIEEELSLLQ